MTEPDPVAALAAQLKELRGQLARAQGGIGGLREQLEAGSGQVVMLRLEIKQLNQRLDEAASKNQLKPPRAPWCGTGGTEDRVMLAGLREWVETFLRPHYADYLTRIPRCWPAHRAAVWELSTLRAEWIRIYADEENRDLRGALDWHDRYLPGVIARLAGAIKCDEAGCLVTRSRVA